MAPLGRFRSVVTYVIGLLTLSPTQNEPYQEPIPINVNVGTVATRLEAPAASTSLVQYPVASLLVDSILDYPVFKPPTGRPRWEGSDFECEYPEMTGYVPCSTPKDRGCWLKNPETGHRYDIDTDYEMIAPKGIMRNYTLVVEDGLYNPDGLLSKDMKLVNGTYPGPWIQACWGDTLNVKVINKLKHNGTAVHFHGIRQNQTMHMDGVPGITQCPIAPNDYFFYKFRVTQYGSSWYHSHYSVQYADGLLGPLTLHGPSTGHWDEPKLPILMSDWFHNSAFQVIHGKVPGFPTILLNGTGDVTKHQYKDDNGTPFTVTPNAPIPAKYQLHFEPKKEGQKAKRYVLRLINTAFMTTFAFSIDNHKLIIVGADLVPVEPATRDFIQIGIGQRYTVIVEADPVAYQQNPGAFDGNFWIRTTVTDCSQTAAPLAGFDQTGILRYDPSNVRDPVTKPWPSLKKDCIDEKDLVPRRKWKIGNAKNGYYKFGEEFAARFNGKGPTPKFPLGKWAFDRHRDLEPGPDPPWIPLQIDYDDPSFLHLNEVNKTNWKDSWMVINEDFGKDDWVYLAITRWEMRNPNNTGIVAHPIHLHGHDFAVVQTEYNSSFPPKNLEFNFTTDNPLRRDVVLLPKRGWVVIAFKTDNPGNWIMHCHIAFHASEGLALQINERQKDADRIWPNPDKNGVFDSEIIEANRVCKRWKDFQHDCTQHWPGKDEARNCWPACRPDKPNEKMYACNPDPTPNHVFQDDSGI